ncbi:MAG: metal ABC transporter permease [Spirochaetaceae bacterium]
MSELRSILSIPVIRNALIGMVFAGATLSLLGALVVSLHLQVMRFMLMHVGLLGAAGGLFMTGSLAAAFILLARAGVPAMDVFAVFAGNILMPGTGDLAAVIVLGAVILAALILFYREIQLVLYDAERAQALGVRVRAVILGLFLLLGAGIAAAAVVETPQVTASTAWSGALAEAGGGGRLHRVGRVRGIHSRPGRRRRHPRREGAGASRGGGIGRGWIGSCRGKQLLRAAFRMVGPRRHARPHRRA